MENTITLGEFKNLLKYLIDNNRVRYEMGCTPIAIGIEGPAGIGKTESIKQVAEELDYGYIRLNLAELEEISDLTGFPVKEYKTIDGKWIASDIINCCNGLEFTGEMRMSYAKPAWLPPEDGGGKRGWILALDDYTRKN